MARSKYKAVPTVVDGVRFASKKEARRDAELKILERAGRISFLHRQRKFDLIVNGVKVCRYVADWAYVEDHKAIVEDAKGVQTPAFKIKWALAKALHPEIEWRLS